MEQNETYTLIKRKRKIEQDIGQQLKDSKTRAEELQLTLRSQLEEKEVNERIIFERGMYKKRHLTKTFLRI